MKVEIQLIWIIIASIISFFVGILLDILLPERYRIKFQLKKKKLSKWIKNPSYIIGLASRLDFKHDIGLNDVTAKLKQIFSAKKSTYKGTELHLKYTRSPYDIDIIIQTAYEEGENEFMLQAYSLNIMANSKTKYRDIKSQIDDLRAALEETEKEMIKHLDIFPARRILYAEIEYLEELSEILENLKAKQITGLVKDTNVKFTYHENTLTIEDTINSKTIEWFKNIISYVG